MRKGAKMMAELIDRQAALEEIASLQITINGLREGKTILQEALTAYRKAVLAEIEAVPPVDAVPRDVLEQIRWERDIAIEQLNSYGVSLGEKADCAKVVRCKDCKWYKDFGTNYRLMDCSHEEGLEWVGENDFCSYGERRDDDG